MLELLSAPLFEVFIALKDKSASNEHKTKENYGKIAGEWANGDVYFRFYVTENPDGTIKETYSTNFFQKQTELASGFWNVNADTLTLRSSVENDMLTAFKIRVSKNKLRLTSLSGKKLVIFKKYSP